MNIKFGIVGNDNLGGVGVGLQLLNPQKMSENGPLVAEILHFSFFPCEQ